MQQAETTVYLAPEQMAQLAQQGQGNTALLAAGLAFVIFCLVGIWLRSAT